MTEDIVNKINLEKILKDHPGIRDTGKTTEMIYKELEIAITNYIDQIINVTLNHEYNQQHIRFFQKELETERSPFAHATSTKDLAEKIKLYRIRYSFVDYDFNRLVKSYLHFRDFENKNLKSKEEALYMHALRQEVERQKLFVYLTEFKAVK